MPITRYINFQKLQKNSTTLVTNIKNAVGEKNMFEVKNKNCLDFNFYLALHKKKFSIKNFFILCAVWDLVWVRNSKLVVIFPANNYLFKINGRNTKKGSELCSKLTIKKPEWYFEEVHICWGAAIHRCYTEQLF